MLRRREAAVPHPRETAEEGARCARTHTGAAAVQLTQRRRSVAVQVWINQGDIILVGLREFENTRGDVLLKYTSDEARNLKAYGELPDHIKINDTTMFGEGDMDDDIRFDLTTDAERETEVDAL